MGKNKIHIQVALLALLVLLFCVYILMFNEKKQLQKSYYQYHIGVMHIEHPILVEFVEKDMWYVCPDSVLYCCNDSNWLFRDDVFPYLLVAFNTEQQPTYYPQIPKSMYSQQGYYPYYKSAKQISDKFTIYHFYYGLNKFDCYLEAKNGFWYDVTDPCFQNPWADEFNYFQYSKEYQMVVQHKYNIFQLFCLKQKYRIYKKVSEQNGIIMLPEVL